jgi:tetratricopeptide (TPR) repeat protein
VSIVRSQFAASMIGLLAVAAPAQDVPANSSRTFRERLLEVVPFPKTEIRFGFHMAREDFDFEEQVDPAVARREVDALKEALAANPGHADGWSRLGRMLMVLEKEKEAEEAHAMAAALLAVQCEEPGASPLLRVTLGKEWVRAALLDEAVRVLEAAVEDHPDSAEARIALGEALGIRAYLRVLPTGRHEVRPGDPKISIPRDSTEEALLRSREEMAGAFRNFDRAVALAPERVEFRALRSCFRLLVAPYFPVPAATPGEAMLRATEEVTGDLRALAAARPGAAVPLAMLVQIESMLPMIRESVRPGASPGAVGGEGGRLARPSPDIDGEAARLGKVAASLEGRKAALAHRALACYHGMLRGDLESARKSARGAALANPGDDHNWYVLAIFAGDAFPPESTPENVARVSAIAEERLKAGESTPFRLLAARHPFAVGRTDLAERHVAVAFARDPEDPRVLLAHAAVQLRRGDPMAPGKMRGVLEKAAGLLGSGDRERRACLEVQWTVVRLLLRDSEDPADPARGEARIVLRSTLAAVPGYAPALELLRILEEDSPSGK